MKLIDNTTDERRTNVAFSSLEDAFKFRESKHELRAHLVLIGLVVLDGLKLSKSITPDVEIPFRDTRLEQAARRLGQFSLEEASSTDTEMQARAATAQANTELISNHLAEKSARLIAERIGSQLVQEEA